MLAFELDMRAADLSILCCQGGQETDGTLQTGDKGKNKRTFTKIWAGLEETSKGGGSHSGKPLVLRPEKIKGWAGYQNSERSVTSGQGDPTEM